MPLVFQVHYEERRFSNMKCNNPRCESTELVYSGVDAMVLGGIPTEEFCYTCAVAYVAIQNRIAELQDATIGGED